MKKYTAQIMLGILVGVVSPLMTHAAYLITEKAPTLTSDTYTANYSATVPPAVIKVYARVTEFGTNNWNYNVTNVPLISLATNPAGYPKQFAVDFNFSSLGIVVGKKYTYYLADGPGPNSLLLTNPACFTTTGSVACTTVTNAPLTTTSFTLNGLDQASDPNNPNKYLGLFSIVPNSGIVTPIPLTFKVFKEVNGIAIFLKEGNFPSPTSGNTTFPTVDNLDVGIYSGQLYSGTTKVSGEVGFQIVSTDPAQNNGTFIGNSFFDVYIKSITPQSNGAEIIFGFKTKDGSSKTVGLGLFGIKSNDSGGSFQLWKAVYAGTINGTLSSETVTVTGLSPSTNYTFELRDSVSGSVFGPESFTTLSPGGTPPGGVLDFSDQTSNGISGVCGAAHTSSTPSLTAQSATLCANSGTVIDFKYDGFNYSWKCKGSDGTTQTCSATGGEDTNYGSNFLKNPLAPGLDTFPKIFAAVYNNIILPIAIPFIVLAIMFAGFKFVVAQKQGSTDGYTEAKRILKYTLIGTGLLLGGWVIANALQGTLNSLLGQASFITDTIGWWV